MVCFFLFSIRDPCEHQRPLLVERNVCKLSLFWLRVCVSRIGNSRLCCVSGYMKFTVCLWFFGISRFINWFTWLGRRKWIFFGRKMYHVSFTICTKMLFSFSVCRLNFWFQFDSFIEFVFDSNTFRAIWLHVFFNWYQFRNDWFSTLNAPQTLTKRNHNKYL